MTRLRLLLAAALVAALVGPLGAARAATESSCLPNVNGTPAAGGVCDGIGAHPGAAYQGATNGCSANFVFEGSDGDRYIGTAGHCILFKYGGYARTWPKGDGPWVKFDGRLAGEFAYATFSGSLDFGLIRLDPDFPWSPSMLHFGGPTGMYTDHVDEPVVVHHAGNGLGIGNVWNKTTYGVGPQDVRPLAARTGVARHTLYEQVVFADALADFGDSGSPVITADGRALGTLVALADGTEGTTEITRLDDSLALAEETLGITLTLQTAPLRAT